MSQACLPNDILILTNQVRHISTDYEPRRGEANLAHMPSLEPIELTQMQEQINVFLQQLDIILQDASEAVGKFRLSEFEVSAGIVVEGKGKIKLAWIVGAEIGGAIDTGLKFTFKRT